MDKPIFLGDDDLPDPRVFVAPYGYDPGPIPQLGSAMIATVTQFKDPKLADLEEGLCAEHARLERLLTHDFKCRISEDSMVSVLNPTVSEFCDGLERLRRMSLPTGYIFIYICTRVATIKGKDTGFMCFKDTNWKNADLARESTVPVSKLTSLINALPGSNKVIALSIAHPHPPPKRFSSSLKPYPPRNFYSDLADRCKCAVLGSCNIGETIRQQLIHTSPLPVKEKENAVLRAIRLSKRRKKLSQETENATDAAEDSNGSEDSESDDTETEESRRTVGLRGKIRYRRYRRHEMCPAVVLDHLDKLDQIKRKRTERDAMEIREPHTAWQRNEEKGYIIVTPHPREVRRHDFHCNTIIYLIIFCRLLKHRNYYWAKKYEGIKKGLRPWLDNWSDSSLESKWLSHETQRQYSFSDQGYVFD